MLLKSRYSVLAMSSHLDSGSRPACDIHSSEQTESPTDFLLFQVSSGDVPRIHGLFSSSKLPWSSADAYLLAIHSHMPTNRILRMAVLNREEIDFLVCNSQLSRRPHSSPALDNKRSLVKRFFFNPGFRLLTVGPRHIGHDKPLAQDRT